MSDSGHGLFRAEHRGLRELHAAARHLCGHWEKLAGRLEGQVGTALRAGAAAGRELVAELEVETQARGLETFPAAHGAGSRAAGLRNSAGDLLLERNQAARGVSHADVRRAIDRLGEEYGDWPLSEAPLGTARIRGRACVVLREPDGCCVLLARGWQLMATPPRVEEVRLRLNRRRRA